MVKHDTYRLRFVGLTVLTSGYSQVLIRAVDDGKRCHCSLSKQLVDKRTLPAMSGGQICMLERWLPSHRAVLFGSASVCGFRGMNRR